MSESVSESSMSAADRVYGALMERTGESLPAPRLSATRRAVELLGDPQDGYEIVHVTGTNGKTSTSRIAESLLRAHGLRTGLFTSPHLVRFTERIQIDGEQIDGEQLERNWLDVEPVIRLVDAQLAESGERPLTFFEALTVLAFACFADAPVDVAVIEVGMGGEWDSTNVADGRVAVFTPISLDHTGRLGTTIEAIARTKSGIIKPGAQVVSARQPQAALAVLMDAAAANEAGLRVEGRDFGVLEDVPGVGGQLVTIDGVGGRYEETFLPLFGRHQGQNAAVAVAAVESLIGGGQRLDPDVLAEGLATATSPGRLQVVSAEPLVVVDGAHNPGGAASLAVAFTENFDVAELALVVGMVADKDTAGIMDALAGLATVIFATQAASDRALPADELADRIRLGSADADVIVRESFADALTEAREWASDEPGRGVLVTGSILLVGDVIAIAEREAWRG